MEKNNKEDRHLLINAFTLIELLAVITILAVIALIATPIVKKSIDNSKEQALKETINSIEKAAYNYGYQNDIGYSTEYKKLTLDELINKGFLKGDIINPVTNEKMNGCVLYRWNETNNQYEFKYEIECPKYPESLITVLLEQYNESNTKGLVKDSTNPNLYYYTGTKEEVTNNFLWYGGHQWRILDFDTSSKTLTLITQQPLAAVQPAKSVWTTKELYESSFINSWLNDYFYNSFDESIKANILNTTFNIGIYTDVDEITTEQKVGLIDNDQFTRAGGVNCFLEIGDAFYLGNRYNSTSILRIGTDGSLGGYTPNFARGTRAVIKISDVTIIEGDGTLEYSYKTNSKSTGTNDVQVGEYINVPYNGNDDACGSDNICTFRVVSKDNDSVKLTLNGLLKETSLYGDTSTITKNHTIYTPLNTFVNNISKDYLYAGNKTFYFFFYPYYVSYNAIQDETLEANVGLPMIGEIFSGNDIDLNTANEKKFVDINTIENDSVASFFWTMNRYDSISVRSASYYGNYDNRPLTVSVGVRPVIFIKNNLSFSGGNGTAQNPYTLQ